MPLRRLEDESELAIVRSTAQVDEEQHSAGVLERRSRRWYHYLLDHMLTGSFEDNQLAVVTFNFDRSFERALYRVLRANFTGDEEDIRRRCASVPIVHIHGRLGPPDWLELDTAGARPYNGNDLTAQQLEACAEKIRLVTDEIDPAVTATTRQLLSEASTIYFLGFSYHPLNLAKLHCGDFLGRSDNTILGTAFQMPLGPFGTMWRALKACNKTLTDNNRCSSSPPLE
jgi:hypothetical protein